MKTIRRIFQILVLVYIFVSGCTQPPITHYKEPFVGFSAHFLNVGQGDCIFMQFSDGVNMLVDCGENDGKNADFIVKFIKKLGVSKIDYLVLTHPDADHIGNAIEVINNFEIKKAFLPKINEDNLQYLPLYKSVVDRIKEKSIERQTSTSYVSFKGQDYGVAFLSPLPPAFNGSSYDDFTSSYIPDSKQTNALSPIIYVQSRGVRFLLTGDAPSSQEKIALESARLSKTMNTYKGIDVNLEDIDFLKVSHHGSNDGSSNEFLQVLKPKNAIISVAGNNYFGHPDDEVLKRLLFHNPNFNLYRTDVNGTISIYVDEQGQQNIVLDANFNK